MKTRLIAAICAAGMLSGCNSAWYQAHKNVINGGIAGAAAGAAAAGPVGGAVGMPIGAYLWSMFFGTPPPPAPAGKQLVPMKQSEK